MTKKNQKPIEIKGGKIHPLTVGNITMPCLIFKGDEPEIDTFITFKIENGVTYTGVVKDTTKADGEVMVEFHDGIQPVSQQ
jgi:hypothetical protein